MTLLIAGLRPRSSAALLSPIFLCVPLHRRVLWILTLDPVDGRSGSCASQYLVHPASSFHCHFFCLPRPLLQKICASVNNLTTGGEKMCEPLLASSTRRRGDANARMDGGTRRRGRDRPDLVGRRDVQLGPRGRLGNEFGRDIASC
jgi:hypothetical protein